MFVLIGDNISKEVGLSMSVETFDFTADGNEMDAPKN